MTSPTRYKESLGFIAIGLCVVSGCGGGSKTLASKAPLPKRTAHPVRARATLRLVSKQGARITLLKGTLTGDLNAQLTLMADHSASFGGAFSPTFQINTPKGEITMRAKLSKISMAKRVVVEYSASPTDGTGIFRGVSSNNLLFVSQESSQTAQKQTTVMTGTLYY